MPFTPPVNKVLELPRASPSTCLIVTSEANTCCWEGHGIGQHGREASRTRGHYLVTVRRRVLEEITRRTGG